MLSFTRRTKTSSTFLQICSVLLLLCFINITRAASLQTAPWLARILHNTDVGPSSQSEAPAPAYEKPAHGAPTPPTEALMNGVPMNEAPTDMTYTTLEIIFTNFVYKRLNPSPHIELAIGPTYTISLHTISAQLEPSKSTDDWNVIHPFDKDLPYGRKMIGYVSFRNDIVKDPVQETKTANNMEGSGSRPASSIRDLWQTQAQQTRIITAEARDLKRLTYGEGVSPALMT
ncbi:hypothetical protein C8R42DRAFT_346877 [Lentinula raphanica]|nr:hypothetical protein C8R42DRAFT_346877 [Lentinula raphanica]